MARLVFLHCLVRLSESEFKRSTSLLGLGSVPENTRSRGAWLLLWNWVEPARTVVTIGGDCEAVGSQLTEPALGVGGSSAAPPLWRSPPSLLHYWPSSNPQQIKYPWHFHIRLNVCAPAGRGIRWENEKKKEFYTNRFFSFFSLQDVVVQDDFTRRVD